MDLGVLLGIAGILLGFLGSYYFYRKSIPLKEARWSANSYTIVEDNISNLSDVKVFYKDAEVSNLTISKILFWNKSNTTISREDIASANPLRIVVLNNAILLDAKVLDYNNPSSLFSITYQDNISALIDFDYLDKGNGGVIQVIHTSKTANNIKVLGDIKGGKTPKEMGVPTRYGWINDAIEVFILMAIGTIVLCITTLIMIVIIESFPLPEWMLFIPLILFMITILLTGVFQDKVKQRLWGFPKGLAASYMLSEFTRRKQQSSD